MHQARSRIVYIHSLCFVILVLDYPMLVLMIRLNLALQMKEISLKYIQ